MPLKLGGKTARNLRQFTVRRSVASIAAMSHHRRLRSVPTKLIHEAGQMGAHNSY